MYICICKAVTDRQIREAIDQGNTRIGDLKRKLGVCSGCGKCESSVRDILHECQPRLPSIHQQGLHLGKATC